MKNNGYLYHYNRQPFEELRSKRAQGVATAEDEAAAERSMRYKKLPGLSIDSISLFLEPVPLDIIAKCFRNEHSFWKSGTELFEHHVPISGLPNCPWMMCETPYSTAMIDTLPWYDDDAYKRQYFDINHRLLTMMKDVGDDKAGMVASISRYIGTTREHYLKISKRDDFYEILDLYAATVPHLMIYPPTGILPVKVVRRVVVK